MRIDRNSIQKKTFIAQNLQSFYKVFTLYYGTYIIDGVCLLDY